jgi:signal transduction histidine kinase/ligand-binding sensor domain-containing protein
MMLATVLFCLLLCAAPMLAQVQPLPTYLRHPYRFRHINTEHGGLSQNTVFAALQDRKGFLWIATGDGLNRYDGHSCKVFRHNPSDSTTISAHQVFSILEDSEGNIWCGTIRELNLYIPQTGTFERYYNQILGAKSPSQFALSMFEDIKKRLWVCTGAGLFYLDKKTKDFIPASQLDSSGNVFDKQRCQRLPNGQKRNVIALFNAKGITDGLCELDPVRDRFIPVQYKPKGSSYLYSPLYLDSKGTFWNGLYEPTAGKVPSLWTYHPSTQEFRQSSVFSGDVLGCTVQEDDFGNYWFASPNSLRIFNPHTLQSDTIRYNANDPEGLASNLLHTYIGHTYKHGKHYISTDGGGVNLFKPKFTHIHRTTETETNQLSANMLWGMAEDSLGYVWAATIGGGINRFNPSTGEIRSFLGKAQIRPVFCDTAGTIWTEDLRARLIRITETGSVQPRIRYFDLPIKDKFWHLLNIIQDRYGKIWCSLLGGTVFRFDPETKKFTHTFPNLGTTLHLDSKGSIWAGDEGITIFDPADADRIRFSGKDSTPHLFTRFRHEENNPSSLADNVIKHFHEDTDGTMWIATIRGLDHFDPATKRFTHYNEQSGMPNSYVYGILPDDNGNLWVSTNRGLSKFNKTSKTWRNYSPYDGLQSYEFDRSSFVRLRKGGTDGRMKGWMLFGGVNGFNIFHPDSVRDNPDKPPVAITNVLINEKPYSDLWRGFQKDSPQYGTAEVSELTALELAWTDNTLSFEFAALEFTDPEKNQYAYQMEGIDKGWVQSGTLRTARYAGLSPGDYVFRVRACNNDGVWNEDGTRLRIRIVPPFWRTAWFYGLLLVGGVGIVVGTTRTISRQRFKRELALTTERLEAAQALERERLEKALELERERRRISQDIHDEVGSGLTKILMLTQNATETAQPNKEIAGTAQGVIDGMQEIIWSINPKNDTLQSLVAFIRSYGREFVSAAGMNVIVETPEGLAATPLRTDVRRNVFLAVKEALNNALKYSAATEIRIGLEVEQSSYIFTIADNGRGFIPDVERLPTMRGGNGLENMRLRMEEIGGSFHLDSVPNEGTKIVLEIPR